MKILITGGAGFIGRWVLQALPEGVEVVVVDSLVEQVHGRAGRFPDDVLQRATCLKCDLRDVEQWRRAATGAETVVHLASLTGTAQSMSQQSRYIEHNILATSALCGVLAGLTTLPRRIILASSRAVYGEGAYLDGDRLVHPGPRRIADLAQGRWDVEAHDGARLTPTPVHEDAPLRPVSFYGLTKLWQEQALSRFARAHGIDLLILRFQNVYGPHQPAAAHAGIVAALASGIAHERRVELFEDGEMTRDFVHVHDAADAIVEGIGAPRQLDCTLNVGSGTSVSLRDLTRRLAELLGPTPIVECHGRYRQGDVRHAVADMAAFERVFGPRRHLALSDGLAEYVRWFIEQPGASSRPGFAPALEAV
jgi:dTDP-L-rhamnose 4-epimerase